jgi:hypothetical protein
MAQGATARCYHHKRNETSHDWPRPGRRSARRRAHGRAVYGRPRPTRVCRSSNASSGSRCRVPGPQFQPFQPPEPRRSPDSSPRHDTGRAIPGSGGAICGPGQSFREPRRRRLPAPLPSRGRHSLARGYRRLFSPPRRSLRPFALARNPVAYPHTSDHRTLWVTAGVVAVFLYLGVSSFWRAHRRSKQS